MANTSGQLENITIYTNRFLDPITSWEEKKVVSYKKQIFLHYFSAWFAALMIFVLFNTMLSIAGSAFLLPFIWLPVQYQGIGYAAVLMVVFGIAIILFARKRTIQLIKRNNGEIGHKGQPFVLHGVVQVLFGLLFAIVATIGFAILTYYLYIDSFEGQDFDIKAIVIMNLVELTNFSFAFYLPFFYGLGTLFGISKMRHGSTCPVCGRLDSLSYYSMGEFAKMKRGDYEKDITRTARVGTETTTITTYYSDGSKSVSSSSSPIYGQVYDHTDFHEYGTKMERYAVSCRGCSYHREMTEKRKYDEITGRTK